HRTFDDGRRNTKPPRNLQARRCASNANKQPVSRPQSLFIKLDAGIHYTFFVARVHLESTGVRRSNNVRTTISSEVIDNRDSKRGSLFRISSSANFVEQDEGGGLTEFEHVRDVCDVRRKRRKIC